MHQSILNEKQNVDYQSQNTNNQQKNNLWEQDIQLDDSILNSMLGGQPKKNNHLIINSQKSNVNQPTNIDFFTNNDTQPKKSNLKQLIITK